jgi:hypothetical protein
MKLNLNKTWLAAAAVVLALPEIVLAQNHYPAGAEGIKAATLPPPGVYFRDYNFFYWANDFPGGPPNFDVFAYVNAPRVIWMTDVTILGANYGMDVIVPFGISKVSVGSNTDKSGGLGDMQFEPVLLAWHPKQWDFALAYSIWAPTGDDDELGKGFWSHMFTAGATWYPDEQKLWSASALSRYEIHTESDNLNVTPGDTFTLEFGVARTLKPGMDLGLVGYWQQQVNDDSAPGFSADPTKHDRVWALGPEITAVCPKLAGQFSLRYLREFSAQQRPEGNTVTLTFTRRF